MLVVCVIFLGKKLLSTKWETYTDRSAGFSVKYPRGWKVENSNELKIRSEGIRIYKKNKEFLPGIHIYFSPQALVVKELISENYQIEQETFQERTIQIGNHQMLTISFFKDLPIFCHFVEYREKSYIFIARGNKEEAVLQKMLATLIFLE